MVLSFIDEGVYYKYAPEVNIYGRGNTEEESEKKFESAIDTWLKDSNEDKGFFEKLLVHGWTMSSSEFTPPSFNSMLKNHTNFLEIIEHKSPVIHNAVELFFDFSIILKSK